MNKKPYIRIYGRYIAACVNENATLQLVEEHLHKERVRPTVVANVIGDLRDWFKQAPEENKTHTVKVDDGKNNPIIVAIIPRKH